MRQLFLAGSGLTGCWLSVTVEPSLPPVGRRDRFKEDIVVAKCREATAVVRRVEPLVLLSKRCRNLGLKMSTRRDSGSGRVKHPPIRVRLRRQRPQNVGKLTTTCRYRVSGSE